ncbi:MAG: RNB domain-containing ribonuclease [Spirochaetaceae bacterium]|jgi:exoribonuclease-2|nr:RNB domain-containing ribonuclease [Spirochaetaceae bacterium]
MISEKSLVAYKNRPALVTAQGEKLEIAFSGGETLKVREKDVELVHPGPVRSAEEAARPPERESVREAWELLEGGAVPLKELAELAYGDFSPRSAWAAYVLLKEGLYFSGTVDSLRPRDAGAVAAGEQKREEKQREIREREAFLERLKKRLAAPESPPPGPVDPADGRFLQDVEALAFGKAEKSRTLKDLGRSESPEEAHRVLLRCGAWTQTVNPHPARFGVSPVSSLVFPGLPPNEEERLDLTGLPSFAIDNAWSVDPDDAVYLEGNCLWVHVADPAASVLPGSPADIEARNRGATLYLPEGSSRMLAEEALPVYALGLSEVSPALSFKITLGEDGSVAETEIIPSRIAVIRMTYAEADAAVWGDAEAAGPAGPYTAQLTDLFRLAERNLARRTVAGAVTLDFPEVHIAVREGEAAIQPIAPCRSADMVRECMLLAGEGAARWASRRTTRLPFPFVTQETGDIPKDPLPGLAGFCQIRRCMRPRTLSVKPGRHSGLGLEQYTQVTSPLRRYTDLLAHQQIRSALGTGAYRNIPPRDDDAMLAALAAGEAAAAATVRAERASRAHWTAVYLAGRKGSEWDGIVLEKKGARAAVLIPGLGLETQAALKGDAAPNDPVRLIVTAVSIPAGEGAFNHVEGAPNPRLCTAARLRNRGNPPRHRGRSAERR